MAGKSRGIDTYATRHCPVVIYRNEKKVAEYPSISECAKKMGMTPAKVKHFLHYPELYNELDFDIPVTSIYETKIETVVRKRGLKKIVRIVRGDRPKKPVRRFERVYIGGNMKIRPLDTNILIEKEEEKKTKSGLILIENDNYSGLSIGTIKAIGENVESVKVGDKVLYQDADTTPVTMDGKTLYIVEQGNLFGVITG